MIFRSDLKVVMPRCPTYVNLGSQVTFRKSAKGHSLSTRMLMLAFLRVTCVSGQSNDGDESPYPVIKVFDNSVTLRARIHGRGAGASSGNAARMARIPQVRKPLGLVKIGRSKFQRTWSKLFLLQEEAE